MFAFNKTYKLPFKYDVPNYTKEHLQKKNIYKRFLKFFKRYFYIVLKSQKNLEIFSILPSHQKILWINVSAPSFGDSLMDLSSRVLLLDRNIDLFTDVKNKHIYKDDEIFNNVFSQMKEMQNIKYNLVILDSYSSRSIKVKSLIAPMTPYVGMFGYFNGPEVNRILFSFHQMNNLLGSSLTENEINNIAKNFITISKSDKLIVNDIVPEDYIAIALGGEWEYKTYKKWDEIIEQIISYNEGSDIVLIGSNNAIRTSQEIIKKFSKYNFLNFVARLTFNQTVEVIRQSKILLCCDGGLFHGATAVNAITLSLLARLKPEMLVTKNTSAFSLYDDHNVNTISVNDVVSKYHEVFNLFDNHPQSE